MKLPKLDVAIPAATSTLIIGLLIGSAFGHQLRKDYHHHLGKKHFWTSMKVTLEREHIIATDIFDSMEVVYQQISREYDYDPYYEIDNLQSWRYDGRTDATVSIVK